MDRLSEFLNKDDIIVTDMGTALLSGHQALKLKSSQRMFTSQDWVRWDMALQVQ